MSLSEQARVEHEELMDLWHDRLLQAHFRALPNGVARSSFIMRPPNLEEGLRELAVFGEVVLASHDEPSEDGERQQDHVCSVRLRGYSEADGLVVASGLNPTLAALHCLLAVLALLFYEAEDGFAAFDAFLNEN